MASRHGICDAVDSSSFDSFSGNFITYLSKSLIKKNCPEYNYLFAASNNSRVTEFQVKVNSPAVMTSLAVAFNILPTSLLSPMVYENGNPTINYVNVLGTFSVTRYIDSRYAGMDPVFCSVRNNQMNNTFCFVESSPLPGYGIPITLNAGSNLKAPSPCTCPAASSQKYCQLLYLFAGIIVVPSIDAIFELQSRYTPNEFNDAAYNAAFITTALSLPSKAQNMILTRSYIESSFAFCQTNVLTNDNCTAIIWKEYSDSAQTVSPYYYQLFNGSCRDSILVESAIDALAEIAPVSLNENYLICKNNIYNAILAAFGIAQGNVQTAAPIILGALLPVIYLYLKMIGYVPPKIEYTPEEMQVAINELALQIVRARDGKTRAMKKNGLLVQLSGELLKVRI